MFSRLLCHPAWKWRGPVLILALDKFVNYPLTYSPGTHTGPYIPSSQPTNQHIQNTISAVCTMLLVVGSCQHSVWNGVCVRVCFLYNFLTYLYLFTYFTYLSTQPIGIFCMRRPQTISCWRVMLYATVVNAITSDIIWFIFSFHYDKVLKSCQITINKSSAIAEMGDRLATIVMVRKVGLLCPFPLGELGPHLTQHCLGQGLPPYQVVSWSIQPFGHNTPMLQTDRTDNGPVAQRELLFVSCNGRPKTEHCGSDSIYWQAKLYHLYSPTALSKTALTLYSKKLLACYRESRKPATETVVVDLANSLLLSVNHTILTQRQRNCHEQNKNVKDNVMSLYTKLFVPGWQ